MQTNKFSLVRVLFAAAIVASIAGGAWGAPLFTDSFDGADGTGLMAYNSHYTVDGSPVSGDKAEIDSPGLAIAGKLSAGNSLYITRTANQYNSYHNESDIPDTLLNTTGQAVYLSAFFKAEEMTANSCQFYVAMPFEVVGGSLVREQRIGLKYNSTLDKIEAWLGYASGSGGPRVLADYTPGDTVQIVLRMVVNANKSLSVAALVNPAVGDEPSNWYSPGSTDVTTNGWELNYIELGAYRPSTSSVTKGWIDEIRIGSSYADVVVVPEPATMSLLALGGLALIRRRRA